MSTPHRLESLARRIRAADDRGRARGLVIPQAVGNDMCCGMRLLVTEITRDELEGHLDAG